MRHVYIWAYSMTNMNKTCIYGPSMTGVNETCICGPIAGQGLMRHVHMGL